MPWRSPASGRRCAGLRRRSGRSSAAAVGAGQTPVSAWRMAAPSKRLVGDAERPREVLGHAAAGFEAVEVAAFVACVDRLEVDGAEGVAAVRSRQEAHRLAAARVADHHHVDEGAQPVDHLLAGRAGARTGEHVDPRQAERRRRVLEGEVLVVGARALVVVEQAGKGLAGARGRPRRRRPPSPRPRRGRRRCSAGPARPRRRLPT